MTPPGDLVVLARGPEEMKAVGAVLARQLHPGDTVLLGGDLGAGKTTLVQGLAGALGVREPVTSPTFVLVHSYRTPAGWDLLHADVWRLEQLQEVIDLALPELVEEGGAAVVEWGEMAAPALAADCLYVVIDFEPEDQGRAPVYPGTSGPGTPGPGTPGPGTPGPGASAGGAAGPRRLAFRALGPAWRERMAGLQADLVAAL